MLSQSISQLLLRFCSWTTYVYLEFSLLRVYKLVYIVVVYSPIYPSSLEPVKVATGDKGRIGYPLTYEREEGVVAAEAENALLCFGERGGEAVEVVWGVEGDLGAAELELLAEHEDGLDVGRAVIWRRIE